MIAADIQKFALDNLPINWFDAVLVGLLIAGLFRGRKHGMSKEVLPLLKWLTLVLVSGFCYPLAAQLLVNTAGLKPSASCLWGYLLLAVVVLFVFWIIKRLMGYRLSENNFFGSGEYYLGMVSGMVRFFCMLLAVVALLNGPYYSQADIQAHNAYVKRWFGGGLYSGNYFPDLQTIQQSVFKNSFLGPYFKDYLGPILVETTPPNAKEQQKTAVVNVQK